MVSMPHFTEGFRLLDEHAKLLRCNSPRNTDDSVCGIPLYPVRRRSLSACRSVSLPTLSARREIPRHLHLLQWYSQCIQPAQLQPLLHCTVSFCLSFLTHSVSLSLCLVHDSPQRRYEMNKYRLCGNEVDRKHRLRQTCMLSSMAARGHT